MNEFSPKAETSDMEPARTRSASQRSLFLPAQSTASSATGSAVLRASEQPVRLCVAGSTVWVSK